MHWSVDYGCLANWVDLWIMAFNKLGWSVYLWVFKKLRWSMDYGCLTNWVDLWITGMVFNKLGWSVDYGYLKQLSTIFQLCIKVVGFIEIRDETDDMLYITIKLQLHKIVLIFPYNKVYSILWFMEGTCFSSQINFTAPIWLKYCWKWCSKFSHVCNHRISVT